MNSFNFYNPTQIIYGNNKIEVVGEKVNEYTKTKNVLLVISESCKRNGSLEIIKSQLVKNKINYFVFDGIVSNPNMNSISNAKLIIKHNNIDFVLAIGGASVVDTAKTICVASANNKDIWHLICNPSEIKSAIDLGVVITLYGSGTEMTNGAVITNLKIPKKRGFDSVYMYPKFSIIDPSLLRSVTKDYLMIGATDMLTHVLEQYFEISNNDNLSDPYLELLSKQIINEIYRFKDDTQNNDNLFWLSTLAQNNFLTFGKQNNGEWIAHIISHEFCLKYNFPHGRVVAVLFLAWLRYIKAINTKRIVNFGSKVLDLTNPSADEVINCLEQIFVSLGNETNFKSMGVKEKDLNDIIVNSINGKKLGKFKEITENDVKKIVYEGYYNGYL